MRITRQDPTPSLTMLGDVSYGSVVEFRTKPESVNPAIMWAGNHIWRDVPYILLDCGSCVEDGSAILAKCSSGVLVRAHHNARVEVMENAELTL